MESTALEAMQRKERSVDFGFMVGRSCWFLVFSFQGREKGEEERR
jgi:hypothetical protein